MKSKLKLAGFLIVILSINLFAQKFSADPKDLRNNATFVSEAPFEKIVGLSSGLDATVTINKEDITKNPKGNVKVKIGTIKTGIALRDKHLISENWLYVEKYPNAEFKLKQIKAQSFRELVDGRRIKVTFVGNFTVHGVTKEVEAQGEITFFKESEQTKLKANGNLLVVSAEFVIKLSDYGVVIPSMVVGKLSENVNISVDFVASDTNTK